MLMKGQDKYLYWLLQHPERRHSLALSGQGAPTAASATSSSFVGPRRRCRQHHDGDSGAQFLAMLCRVPRRPGVDVVIAHEDRAWSDGCLAGWWEPMSGWSKGRANQARLELRASHPLRGWLAARNFTHPCLAQPVKNAQANATAYSLHTCMLVAGWVACLQHTCMHGPSCPQPLARRQCPLFAISSPRNLSALVISLVETLPAAFVLSYVERFSREQRRPCHADRARSRLLYVHAHAVPFHRATANMPHMRQACSPACIHHQRLASVPHALFTSIPFTCS